MLRSRTIDVILLFVFLILFTLVNPYTLRKCTQINRLQKREFNLKSHYEFDSNLLKLSGMGQHRAISAFLWMETLLSSDIEHHKVTDKNSWMYYRFENISELDPYFFNNYLDGGLYLSVIKDDVIGAEKIYEKGLTLFPHDYWLNFYSGFNHYFELGQTAMAIQRFKKILYHPITYRKYFFISSLTVRMQSEEGNLEDSLIALQYLLKAEQDESKILKLKKMIYSTQAEIDLKCLNSGLQNCRKLDAEGVPYKRTKSGWVANQEWNPIRTRKFHNSQKKEAQ
ncbi:MAG: hypothetical protein Fur0010_17560 [Bdellovibrio sp.]